MPIGQMTAAVGPVSRHRPIVARVGRPVGELALLLAGCTSSGAGSSGPPAPTTTSGSTLATAEQVALVNTSGQVIGIPTLAAVECCWSPVFQAGGHLCLRLAGTSGRPVPDDRKPGLGAGGDDRRGGRRDAPWQADRGEAPTEVRSRQMRLWVRRRPWRGPERAAGSAARAARAGAAQG